MVRRLSNKGISRDRHRSGLVQKLWNTKGAIALALMAIVLPACDTNQTEVTTQPEVTTPETTTSTPRENVTTEEVSDQTKALIGKTVTIRSEPVNKIGASSFTVSDEQFFGTESILVVNTSGKPFVLPNDDDTEVQVTGEVRRFVLADINREYNLGLEPNLYVEYEGKPAIVAQAIAAAPDPGEVTEDPKQYYGKSLAVKGEVEDILSPNVFTLDEDELFGAEDLLVLNRASTQNIKDDETVVVTGVLRPFVITDLERDYDLTWDLDIQKKLEAEYSQKPVLVVDSVFPSAVPPAAK